MSKKLATKRVQSAFFSSKRGEVFFSTLAVGFLIAGAFLLFMRHPRTTLVSTNTGSAANMNTGSSVRKAISKTTPSYRVGPLIEDTEWGRWHKGNVGQSFPSVQQPYSMGQSVSVAGHVSIRVDSIDRNWSPQAWQVSPYPSGYQDDAKGKEVILVRFTIKNLSNIPLMYSDDYFSLVRANGHEQRVAELNELTGDQYGSFGQTTPWLQPGALVHTFVPFLVNPGEKPKQFVLTWQTIDSTREVAVPSKNSKGIEEHPYLNIARIPITLSTSTSQAKQASTLSLITFVPDTKFNVTTANVYSTSANSIAP